jgi:hypothetical protein
VVGTHVRHGVAVGDGDDVRVAMPGEGRPTSHEVDVFVDSHVPGFAAGEVVTFGSRDLQGVVDPRPSGVEQGLGGDAADVGAVTTDPIGLDQHDVMAESGQPDRCGEPTGTRPDDRGSIRAGGVVSDHAVTSW